MKRPNTFLQWAAVASSVLLVCGLISYQAGALTWFKANKPRPAGDSTTGDEVLLPGSKSDVIMPGSKYGVITPHQPGKQPADGKQPNPILMGGSKTISISPLIPPPNPSIKGETEKSKGEGKSVPANLPPPNQSAAPPPGQTPPPSR